MNTQHATCPAFRQEIWTAGEDGGTPYLVEYQPVPEPFLLRNHPTREWVSIYALLPVEGQEGVMVKVWLSSSIRDSAAMC